MSKRRKGNFWSKNEKEKMKMLGLIPTPQSGAGELWKEDGHNDYVICQLKSSEKESIRVNKLDIEKLLYHAEIDNKIPIFVIEFIDGPMMIAAPPEELGNLAKYLNNEIYERKAIEVAKIPRQKVKKKIKSAEKSVDELLKMANEELEKERAKEEPGLNDIIRMREERRKEKERWKR